SFEIAPTLLLPSKGINRPSIQATVYRSVINDVIENVKKDFEDSGVDESVLHMLHR
ncbi:4816_t:CDS:2, partial [Racocetra persica]